MISNNFVGSLCINLNLNTNHMCGLTLTNIRPARIVIVPVWAEQHRTWWHLHVGKVSQLKVHGSTTYHSSDFGREENTFLLDEFLSSPNLYI